MTNTTKILAMAVAVLASAFSMNVAKAQDTVSLSSGYENEYVFRGQKVADNIADASLDIALPSNTDFDVRSYWNTTNRTARVGDETDYVASQGFSIDALTVASVGTTIYTYPRVNALRGQTTYTVEPFLSVKAATFLTPTATAGYDLNLHEVFAEGSLSQRIPFPGVKQLALVPSVAVGYVASSDLTPNAAGVKVRNSYYYGTGKFDLVYSIGKHIDVGVGARTNYLDNSVITKNDWEGGFATVKF